MLAQPWPHSTEEGWWRQKARPHRSRRRAARARAAGPRGSQRLRHRGGDAGQHRAGDELLLRLRADRLDRGRGRAADRDRGGDGDRPARQHAHPVLALAPVDRVVRDVHRPGVRRLRGGGGGGRAGRRLHPRRGLGGGDLRRLDRDDHQALPEHHDPVADPHRAADRRRAVPDHRRAPSRRRRWPRSSSGSRPCCCWWWRSRC